MTDKTRVFNCDCLPAMKEFPDNAAYQRQRYNIRKNDPEFRLKKSISAKKSYQKNKEKHLVRTKKYRKDNLEKFNQYRNEYRKTNPNGIYDTIKQGALRRSKSFQIIREEFKSWYLSQERKCIYCGRSESDILNDLDIIQTRAHRLTIDRLDNSVGYILNNIGLCCRRCNTIKGNFFSYDEMIEVGLIIKKRYANQ